MADETTSTETSTQTSGEQQATQPVTSQSGGGDDILATFRKDNRALAKRNAELEKTLAEMSTGKGKLETELAELRAQVETQAKQGREQALLSKLYAQSTHSEFLVRSAYLGAVTDGKIERFPEDPDAAAPEVMKTLSELEPGLFGGQQQATRTASSQSTPLALVGGGVPQSAPPKVTNGQQLPGLLSSAWGGSKK